MAGASEQVVDLIFGRWRSQILYAGTGLGVFDHLAGDRETEAVIVARKVEADPDLLYRLCAPWPQSDYWSKTISARSG